MLPRQKKGQSGLELVTYVTFSLLFFSVFYMTMIHHNIQSITEQRSRQFESIADNLAYQLDIARSIGPGYSHNFTIPANVLGENYNVIVINNLVVVRASQDYARSTTIGDIVGTIGPGFNQLKNIGGTIHVNT